MHFFIERDRFVHDVQHVAKAVSSRTTIPILTGIKIVATKDGVTLTGSDSDISIETFIPKEDEDKQYITLEQEGSIVLQAKYFAEIVKKLSGEEIELIVQDQFAATIKSGSAVFNLNGLDPEEYPRLPQLEEELLFRLPQDMLKNMIRQTVFAVSTQETRPVLTGVNLESDNGVLHCTATDSHRLAMRKTNIERNDENLAFENVVIPGKSLNELSKIIDESNDFIDVVVTENQILFKLKNLLFFSRLLEGKYPVTKNMIPTQSKTTIQLKTKPLLQTLERALLLSREAKNNVINLKTLEAGLIEITSISPEIGKVTERIQSQSFEGEEMRISFNGKNVIDALKVIDSDEIKVEFTGAMSPFVIQPIEQDHYLHLFSPVRTY
ncbi:DNA polymerase III subunit beta [Alkalihalobacillus alcalophilus ATCC 27647 = CGMCC 1.3604]|uniref:Beta sliding clamp n=1 Tax=Alkalihalobacillus alcalophilus ATCC 27647 = CGMCC 1.3604 TaxID=1218173 RepID=A0A094WHM5_ALKAL|nr:DNA polymerase III subunit beta [Alkalihalobacillus alcalophilus]KGA96301.1 DNA polymerase III subunit beta [Alkalihalobacillus alcalophilus ATCC 27647 = CGMCC 1.3604]MED1560357.1 DNA polymerase III subunit beta [Alkalihalobacillus alcalophilus]THG89965.1 DNA polymerase III subunit beta [Alkalihalobacillus alcalophilus ATCC 27647 = CGMCC 1.3604]